jgi:MFS family permease
VPKLPWLAMGVSAGTQVLMAFTTAIAPILAHVVAPVAGVDADRVGVFIAVTYAVAAVAGLLATPWIVWIGPVRSAQGILLLAAAGLLAGSAGQMGAILVCAALLGAAMGGPNPAFSILLGHHAPRDSVGLFLSMRLAAAPLGVALSAFLVPYGVAQLGWRDVLWWTAALCGVVSYLVGRTVHRLDLRSTVRPRWLNVSPALDLLMADAAVRRLCVVSMSYSMVQQCFLGYGFLLLVRKGIPLTVAGSLLAAGQLLAVVTRIVLGHASDRWIAPRFVLAFSGLLMALACSALAVLPEGPRLWWATVAVLCSATSSMTWLGSSFSQLLRIRPPEDIGHGASAVQLFTFVGSMIGPLLVSNLLASGYSYTVAFAGLGGVATLAGLSLLSHRPSMDAESDLVRVTRGAIGS